MGSDETHVEVPRETTAAPRQVASLLHWLSDDWESAACSRCSGEFHRTKGSGHDVCPSCRESDRVAEKLAAESRRVLEGFERWFPGWCQRAGISQRELTATLDKVPAVVKSAIGNPALGIRGMLAGALPERGFGLSGGAGTGKTFALCALFKALAAERVKLRAPAEGLRATRQWLAWVRWPEEVGRLRTDVSRYEDGMAVVDRRARELVEVEALVLDDLGAERIKGEYSDDWATSVLDRVVDSRFNAMRPTWWTTNLSRDEFLGRYGARLFSRLTGDSPLVTLRPAPDLRVAPRPRP